MISFVWPPGTKLPAGTGGSENYTIGQVRELIWRGVSAQVVTTGVGVRDGRNEFVDIPFKSLANVSQISTLEGTIVFINEAAIVETIEPAFVIMHIPPPQDPNNRPSILEMIKNRKLIVTSKYAAALWAQYVGLPIAEVHIAFPFAEPIFAAQHREPNKTNLIRILYAGRLSPEKGIYTLLEAMHQPLLADDRRLIFSVTTAGADKPEGRIIKQLVDAHPFLTVITARKTPAAMAELMAIQDILVMPSNSQYWHETFGIVSIEAQHSGCRVVASNDGGLPETDCGGVTLVKADDPGALARGIREAIELGPLPNDLRKRAANLFTVEQSVDNILQVLFPAEKLIVHPIEKIVLKSSIKLL